MDIYLTKAEMLREENIFRPHEVTYVLLESKSWDIRTYEPEPIEENMPSVPSS